MTTTAPGFLAYLGAISGPSGAFLAFTEHDADPSRIGEIPTMVAEVVDEGMRAALLDWLAATVASLPGREGKLICLGRSGQIALFAKGQISGIDSPLLRTSTEQRGFITSSTIVQDFFVVVGLDGQAFVAELGEAPVLKNWRDIGLKPADSDDEDRLAGSFFDVGGFDLDEIYATGMDGDMRLYDGADWRQLDVGTNANLFAVLCAPDGHVYAAGQDGILVRGRADLWQVIDAPPLADVVVRSLAWFKKNLWIGGDSGVFRFDGQRVDPVNIRWDRGPEEEDEDALTYGRIIADGHRLWSIGSDHVFWTKDGRSWTRILM